VICFVNVQYCRSVEGSSPPTRGYPGTTCRPAPRVGLVWHRRCTAVPELGLRFARAAGVRRRSPPRIRLSPALAIQARASSHVVLFVVRRLNLPASVPDTWMMHVQQGDSCIARHCTWAASNLCNLLILGWRRGWESLVPSRQQAGIGLYCRQAFGHLALTASCPSHASAARDAILGPFGALMSLQKTRAPKL
jgi:hypothetical protein